ncbi:DUF4177 domain-containing protein [Paenibacillus timonensis]|uniref:DUF4177 domain-containing protein n=1 Tax=Paenibacillus timonensis TaxID=225915 RepID=UPI0022E7F66B|nr:DUF4177 domain-containing protein [Paenibacillus timonensis]
MTKWEYKTIKVKTGGFMGGKVDETEFESELNHFGQSGWEVVSCFAARLKSRHGEPRIG